MRKIALGLACAVGPGPLVQCSSERSRSSPFSANQPPSQVQMGDLATTIDMRNPPRKLAMFLLSLIPAVAFTPASSSVCFPGALLSTHVRVLPRTSVICSDSEEEDIEQARAKFQRLFDSSNSSGILDNSSSTLVSKFRAEERSLTKLEEEWRLTQQEDSSSDIGLGSGEMGRDGYIEYPSNAPSNDESFQFSSQIPQQTDDIDEGVNAVSEFAQRAGGLVFLGLTFWLRLPGIVPIFISFFALFAGLVYVGAFGQAPSAEEGNYYTPRDSEIIRTDGYVGMRKFSIPISPPNDALFPDE